MWGLFGIVGMIVLTASSLLMISIAVMTMHSQTHAFSSSDRLKARRFPGEQRTSPEDGRSFLLIVPALDEEEVVLRATITRLANQTLPPTRIVISVPEWDVDTLAAAGTVAEAAQTQSCQVDVIAYRGSIRSKPAQLQSILDALPESGRGAPDVLGIMDAETLTAPALLEAVDRQFASDNPPLAVQGGIQLMNLNDSWVSLRCGLEYMWWFGSRMHHASNMGVVPLGGNTVFFDYDHLRSAGGWNIHNLAEDAEIGIRLSTERQDAIVVGFDPSLSSREEAPRTMGAMIKQRTRWNLGFHQTLTSGSWRGFESRKSRLIAILTLAQPIAQVLTAIALVISLVGLAVVLLTPWSPHIGVAMVTLLPLLLTLFAVSLDMVALRYLKTAYSVELSRWAYPKLAITTPLYQIVLAISALRAQFKFLSGDFAWAKTAHVGTHLTADDSLVKA